MRLRAAGVVVLVLVLGAWTCQVPSDSVSSGSPGATVASGVTTTGLTSLIEGEDWHYVGDATTGLGTAFGTDWGNNGATSQLAFRRREAGVVDVQGLISNTAQPTAPSGKFFVLPVGYRPSASTYQLQATYITDGASDPIITAPVTVEADGDVYPFFDGGLFDPAFSNLTSAYTGVLANVYISGQFFLTPASAP